jgi:hypothetical protein
MAEEKTRFMGAPFQAMDGKYRKMDSYKLPDFLLF